MLPAQAIPSVMPATREPELGRAGQVASDRKRSRASRPKDPVTTLKARVSGPRGTRAPGQVSSRKVLICFGTRPEAIKLAPVVTEFRQRSCFDTRVVVTAQHRQMLDQVLELFEIVPDCDLNLMTANQSLDGLTAAIITGMSDVLAREQPDAVVVQGDTTTTFGAALAAFYRRVRVVHVEAGLRTGNRHAPYPEEINRRLTSSLTDWHFTPTERARKALIAENHSPDRIFTVGNTVIDALLQVVSMLRDGRVAPTGLPQLDPARRLVLITAHRRENFGAGFRNLCEAIADSARRNADVEYIYPVHLNPNVREPVFGILTGIPNVHLIDPCDYASFISLLDRSCLVLTDSGGIQEEAPSLGKPVLVMRDTTERPEAIEAGVARLVGTDRRRIVDAIQSLLDDEAEYSRMSRAQNPYGDGTAARRIADILEKDW
jgi:UDP-N-acetylglucosamine 2-epimerase (non-hydrolysing)